MATAYNAAEVPLPDALMRRDSSAQRKETIDYIRKHPGCTVTDIARDISVNIIRVFGGIKKAYEIAGVDYPERDYNSGVINPEIFRRSYTYEQKALSLLSRLGKVESRVRLDTDKGLKIVDGIFQRKNTTYVVEVKDYRGKNNITMYELRQLFEYMQILDIGDGVFICPRRSFPKRKHGRTVKRKGKTVSIYSLEEIKSGSAGI